MIDAGLSPSRKHRTTDPETSRRAAWSAAPRAGTQRQRILVAIASSSCGLTYDEVSEVTGIRGVSASTRISELHQGGWIEADGERATSAGAKAIVWKLTSKGQGSLHESEPEPQVVERDLDGLEPEDTPTGSSGSYSWSDPDRRSPEGRVGRPSTPDPAPLPHEQLSLEAV